MNLYITEQGTSIRKQGNHLRLTKADKLVGDYLISEISSVNIVGAASISSDAMASLSDAGASVAFLDRGGRFKGKYASQSAKNVYLRLAQYDAYRDEQNSFEFGVNKRPSVTLCFLPPWCFRKNSSLDIASMHLSKS